MHTPPHTPCAPCTDRIISSRREARGTKGGATTIAIINDNNNNTSAGSTGNYLASSMIGPHATDGAGTQRER